jgi:hypothetical protein
MAANLMEYANLTAGGFRQWIATNYGPEHVQRMEQLYPPSSARVGIEGGDCAGATKGSKGCSLWYAHLRILFVRFDNTRGNLSC